MLCSNVLARARSAGAVHKQGRAVSVADRGVFDPPAGGLGHLAARCDGTIRNRQVALVLGADGEHDDCGGGDQ